MNWKDLFGPYPGFWDEDKDPMKEASPFYDQARNATHQYYDPYVDQGRRVNQGLESQFGNMAKNPVGSFNDIASQYQQSPGFEHLLNKAMRGIGGSAAAAGMSGSGAFNEESGRLATQLASEDFQNWYRNVLGQQAGGLQGLTGLSNQGFGAATGAASDIANEYGQQGQMAYHGAEQENQRRQDMQQMFAKLFGGLAGGAFGGPAGAAMGAGMFGDQGNGGSYF